MFENNYQLIKDTSNENSCHNFFKRQEKKYEILRKGDFKNIGNSPMNYLNDMFFEIEQFCRQMKLLDLPDEEFKIVCQLDNFIKNIFSILLGCSKHLDCKKIAYIQSCSFNLLTQDKIFGNSEIYTQFNINIDAFNDSTHRNFDEFCIDKEELEEKIKCYNDHFIIYMENEISGLLDKLVECKNDYTLYLPPTKNIDIEMVEKTYNEMSIYELFKEVNVLSMHLHFARILLDSQNIYQKYYRYEVMYVVNFLKKKVKKIVFVINKKRSDIESQLLDVRKQFNFTYFDIEQKVREYRYKKSNINEDIIINTILDRNIKGTRQTALSNVISYIFYN